LDAAAGRCALRTAILDLRDQPLDQRGDLLAHGVTRFAVVQPPRSRAGDFAVDGHDVRDIVVRQLTRRVRIEKRRRGSPGQQRSSVDTHVLLRM
jgi:hypothetical protein